MLRPLTFGWALHPLTNFLRTLTAKPTALGVVQNHASGYLRRERFRSSCFACALTRYRKFTVTVLALHLVACSSPRGRAAAKLSRVSASRATGSSGFMRGLRGSSAPRAARLRPCYPWPVRRDGGRSCAPALPLGPLRWNEHIIRGNGSTTLVQTGTISTNVRPLTCGFATIFSR